MKAVAVADAKSDLDKVLEDAQKEQILLVRAGKPIVLISGIEEYYDEEDLAIMSDEKFWKMIQERRKDQRPGIPLAEVEAQIAERERAERRARQSAKPRKRKVS